MSKCVFRTDLSQRPVSEPLFCIDAVDMFFRPGMPTVEQCVQMLVAEDEICLGVSDKRAIMQGPRVVGYVRIVDEFAWASGAAAHRGKEGR
jgi:hypothetical protein